MLSLFSFWLKSLSSNLICAIAYGLSPYILLKSHLLSTKMRIMLSYFCVSFLFDSLVLILQLIHLLPKWKLLSMKAHLSHQILLIMGYSAMMLFHLLKWMIGVVKGLLQQTLLLQIPPKVWTSFQSRIICQQNLLKHLLQILPEMLR